MPIRMVKDDNSSSSNDNFPSGGNRRGSGGGGNGIIGILLMLFSKNPKLLIIAAIIFGAYYFFGGGQCNSSQTAQVLNQVFNTGATLDQKVYDEASVYEPLSDNKSNPLPENFSLREYCPKPLNQGQQGSCVGWGSGYAARTILEAIYTGNDPNAVAFSPAFVYNQIHLEDCQGSYINKAVEVMQQKGALPFNKFAYTDENCNRKPTDDELREAGMYKLKGANRLTKTGDDYRTDLLAIKQHLAQKAPVIIGMMVGGSFMQNMLNKDIWIPTESDYNMQSFGGHCMTVVAYDDYKEDGSFQLMNSWGEEWGDKGFAWVRYKDFDYFCKEAYGVFPLKNIPEKEYNRIDCSIALQKDDGTKINLKQVLNSALTVTPILKGTKFKISVDNKTECYIYLFGEEVDKTSYVLFPYTPKHSPYCGITGLRLFPKDYSLQADDKGNKDQFAIVITKVPVDYEKFNTSINQSKGNSYQEKINMVIGTSNANLDLKVNQDEITFAGEMLPSQFFASVITIEKQ